MGLKGMTVVKCPICKGSGKMKLKWIKLNCNFCGGRGKVNRVTNSLSDVKWNYKKGIT